MGTGTAVTILTARNSAMRATITTVMVALKPESMIVRIRRRNKTPEAGITTNPGEIRSCPTNYIIAMSVVRGTGVRKRTHLGSAGPTKRIGRKHCSNYKLTLLDLTKTLQKVRKWCSL